MTYLLFTTTSCPKCPAMKEFVRENFAGFSGEILDETKPDFMTKVQEYGVTVAPVLIVFDDDGNEIFRGSEIYEAEDFLNQTP